MASITYGDTGDYDTLIYGVQTPGAIDYLRQQAYAPMEMLNQGAQQFLVQAQNLYESINGSEALRRARAVYGRAHSIWQDNIIRPLTSMDEIQQAPPAMIPYIMAQPDIRRLHNQQRCEGYGEHYEDIYPDQVGKDHYTYRRVIDGVYMPQEDGTMRCTQYRERIDDPNDVLDFDQKSSVLISWKAIERYMRTGKTDPTSPVNGRL